MNSTRRFRRLVFLSFSLVFFLFRTGNVLACTQTVVNEEGCAFSIVFGCTRYDWEGKSHADEYRQGSLSCPRWGAGSEGTIPYVHNHWVGDIGEEGCGCGGGSNCFLSGTKIDTPDGQRNIEDLKAGDKVLSFDKESKRVVLNTVSEPFVSTRSGYYLIKTVSGREIRVTAEHPFYVGNEPKFLSASFRLLALPFSRLYSL